MTVTDLVSRDRFGRAATDLLGAPINPPRAWFYEKPTWLDASVNGVRVIEDPGSPDYGRAAGMVWDWQTCWMNSPTGECVLVVPSPTGLEVFYHGEQSLITHEGERVNVGAIPFKGGHAPWRYNAIQARNHLDNPAHQALVGRIVEDEIGGLFLGVAVPELTVEAAALVNRSGTSGEWRWRVGMADVNGRAIPDGYDALGPTVVTRGATPRRPRGYVMAASISEDLPHPPIVAAFDPPEDEPMTTDCSCNPLSDPVPAPMVATHVEPPVVPPPPPAAPVPPAPVVAEGTSAEIGELREALASAVSKLDGMTASMEALNARQDGIENAFTDFEMKAEESASVAIEQSDTERLDAVEAAQRDIEKSQAAAATLPSSGGVAPPNAAAATADVAAPAIPR